MPYRQLGVLGAYVRNRFADAVPLLQKAAALDPGNPILEFYLARLYLDLGDDVEASSRHRGCPQALAGPWCRIGGVCRTAHEHGRVGRGAAGRATAAGARFVGNRSGRRAAVAARRRSEAGRPSSGASPLREGLSGAARADAADDRRLELAGRNRRRARAAGGRGRRRCKRASRSRRDSSSGRFRVSAWPATESPTCRSTPCAAKSAQALAALREAEKAGWRGPNWRYYRDFDPNLASIRNEPEFKAVFADIERDMARQRAELAARPKDAPLDLATGN